MVQETSRRSGAGSRAGALLAAAACLAALAISACGMLPPKGESDAGEARPAREEAVGTVEQAAPATRFEEPGELDRLADARPIALPPVRPVGAAAAAAPAKAPAEAAGKGRFRLQIGAENDFDAAQDKKREYERKLGGTVDVVFDAPYYKLRWGFFETRQDAEDKILELGESNIQGFVVKQ